MLTKESLLKSKIKNSRLTNLLPIVRAYIYACNSGISTKNLNRLARYLPTSTKKKKLVSNWIKFVSITKIFKILPTSCNSEGIKYLNLFHDKSDFIAFSQKLSLRKRLYLFKTGKNQDVYFSKIIWGEEVDNVKNELSLKQYFEGSADFFGVFPDKTIFIDQDNVAYVEYKLLPLNSRLLIHKPSKIYNYFLSLNTKHNTIKSLKLSAIKKKPWWSGFEQKAPREFVEYILQNCNKEFYQFMFCHGDLGSENVFLYEEKYFIIDWEKSNEFAPVITDLVGIKLGNNSNEIIRAKNITKNAHYLKEFYTKNIPEIYTFDDFLLAIAYYIGTNYNLANFLTFNFSNENSSG